MMIFSGTDTGDVFLVYAKTGNGRGAGDLTSFLGKALFLKRGPFRPQK